MRFQDEGKDSASVVYLVPGVVANDRRRQGIELCQCVDEGPDQNISQDVIPSPHMIVGEDNDQRAGLFSKSCGAGYNVGVPSAGDNPVEMKERNLSCPFPCAITVRNRSVSRGWWNNDNSKRPATY